MREAMTRKTINDLISKKFFCKGLKKEGLLMKNVEGVWMI